jgi:hypothetical protein
MKYLSSNPHFKKNPSSQEQEGFFWGKYEWIEYIYSILWWVIPDTFVFSIQEVKGFFLNSQNFHKHVLSFPESSEGYIIRSSSPLEWWKNINYEFSGVYKSIVVKTKKELPDALQKVIDSNKNNSVEYLHTKFKYSDHPYIPLIIQPVVRGEFAGVVNRQWDMIIISLSPEFNFGVTTPNNSQTLEYIFFIEKNHILCPYITKESLIFPLLEVTQSILSKHFWNFIFEFTSRNSKIIFFQFKNIPSQKLDIWIARYVNYVPHKKIISFEKIWRWLLELLFSLWYSSSEFAVFENHYFLLYHYLWFCVYEWKTFEHIRIALYDIKFDFIWARNGGNSTIHPSKKEFQDLIYQFSLEFGIDIIFIHFHPDFVFSKAFLLGWKTYTLSFYHDIHEYLFDTKEIKFLIQRVSQNEEEIASLMNLVSQQIPAYKILLSFLESQETKKWNFYNFFQRILRKESILIRCIRQQVRKDMMVFRLLNRVSTSYFWETIWWNYAFHHTPSHIYTLLWDIKMLHNFPKTDIPIAFYTHDFEPTWIPLLEKIDLLIIPRSSFGSHAVALASEFKKNIIFDTKNFNKLQSFDKIQLNVDRNEGKVFITEA